MKEKERAIRNDRTGIAFESFNNFCKRERTKLAKKEVELCIELAKTEDEARKSQLQKELTSLKTKQADLQIGWNNSQLRSLIEAGETKEHKKAVVTEFRTAVNTYTKPKIFDKVTESKYRLTGHAAVFDRNSVDMGYIEQIAPGAFKDAIPRSDVRGLINHDGNLIFARNNSNLRLYEDSIGLLFFASLYEDDPLTIDLMNRVRRRLWTQMSFQFTTDEDDWELRPNGMHFRRIIKVGELFDISVVTYPAYPDATVSLVEQNSLEPKESDFDENNLSMDEWEEQFFNRPIDRDRQRDIERKYRKAERIVNRNKLCFA